MKRFMRGMPRLIGVVAIGAALIAPAVAQTAPADDNNRADMIRGGGSDTTYGLMQQLDAAYNGSRGCFSEAQSGQTAILNNRCAQDARPFITTENKDHDVVTEMFPIGSSNGINQLCQRGLANVSLVDFARSSRAPRSADCNGLRFVAFAKDAIPWAHFTTGASANVTNLTQNQLKGIFLNCTITNWNQVGGGDAPIIVYTAQAGSGTRSAFDTFLGGNSESCIPSDKKAERVVFENNANLIQEADRGAAIFPYSFGRFQQSGGEGSVLGSIDGVAPSPTTISDNTFPYSRLLYNVYRESFADRNATQATLEYIHEKDGWLCKSNTSHSVNPSTNTNYGVEIENIIQALGFVPLPEGAIGGGVAGTSKCRVTPKPA